MEITIADVKELALKVYLLEREVDRLRATNAALEASTSTAADKPAG